MIATRALAHLRSTNVASTSSSSSCSSRSEVRGARGQLLRANMAKKQSWTAREIQTQNEKQKEIESSATPIDSSKVSVPKVMQEKDFWDDEIFESVGNTVGKWGLIIVVVFGAIFWDYCEQDLQRRRGAAGRFYVVRFAGRGGGGIGESCSSTTTGRRWRR